MSFLFGGSKTPSMNLPSTPTTSYTDTVEEEKKKLLQGRTSKQTLLTTAQGVLGDAPTKKKTLLGE